jgi:thiamine-phosphate pyrophosphorylase
MPQPILLYYITDRTAFPGNESHRQSRLLEKIAEAARAGVDYIQLREKDLTTRELEALARQAVAVVREASQLRTENREPRTALLINSRADIAQATAADGVHLRSNDISPQDARKALQCSADTPARELQPRGLLIAVSCHSPEEVLQAQANQANFAVFAPVFEKQVSKKETKLPPSGLSLLAQACQATIPVLALGGITLENAQSCRDAGAAGIAGIRLFQENNIADVVRKLRH